MILKIWYFITLIGMGFAYSSQDIAGVILFGVLAITANNSINSK